MKARILSLVVVLLSAISIYASNPKTKVYSNVDDQTKEYILMDSKNSKLLNKTVYVYDSEGFLQEKSLYEWSETKGWTGVQKYSYIYNMHKLATIVYVEWDKNIATWSPKAQHILHTYDKNGKLLAIKQVDVKGSLIAGQ